MIPVQLLAAGSKLLEFILKYWKQLMFGGMAVWVVICSMSHCGGGKGGSGVDTLSVKVDTFWVLPDTNAIFALYGFDTIADYVRELENRKRFRPASPVIAAADNCRDSVTAYEQLLAESNRTLLECDSLYGIAVSIRGYSDTIRTDSIETHLSLRIKGELFGEPIIKYKYLAPYPIIEKTITLKEVSSPRRKLYLEGGVGARLLWKDNQFNTVVGNVGLGYTDKKNWSYGLSGDFSIYDYTIHVKFRKSFDLGK